jgi:hypothetical protein
LDSFQKEKWNQLQAEQKVVNSSAYSLFIYAIRSPLTRDYYLRRLRIFFNHINLLPNETMENRCNFFATRGIKDPNWACNSIIKFLQFQKERVQKEEITGATVSIFSIVERENSRKIERPFRRLKE